MDSTLRPEALLVRRPEGMTSASGRRKRWVHAKAEIMLNALAPGPPCGGWRAGKICGRSRCSGGCRAQRSRRLATRARGRALDASGPWVGQRKVSQPQLLHVSDRWLASERPWFGGPTHSVRSHSIASCSASARRPARPRRSAPSSRPLLSIARDRAAPMMIAPTARAWIVASGPPSQASIGS